MISFRIPFLLVVMLCINSFSELSKLSATTPKKVIPNIILIYADDMGYGDAGYLGAKDVKTPNIDALAKDGVNFTQGYVSASVCGPSRVGLLTGVYQQRLGLGENAPEQRWYTGQLNTLGIPAEQPILPEFLKKSGYHSKMIGKWHVGYNEELRPIQRGFDEFYGFLNGQHHYFKSDSTFGNFFDTWPVYRNNEVVSFEGYLTDVLSQEAVDYVNNRSTTNEPFFIYLAYNAVHAPWQVPEKYEDRLLHISDTNRRLFGGMLLAMDDGVGSIVKALKDNKLYENTIILFISDNGSPKGMDGTMSNTGGFRGWKGDTYEGGIRVPFIIRWPGVFPEGFVYNKPVTTLDIIPTLLHPLGILENGTEHDFDGKNIAPYITDEKDAGTAPHDTLYWRRDSDYAIRIGDWKLTWNDGDNSETPMLFNIAEDKYESTDLISKYPEKAEELQVAFDAWDQNLPSSLWWGGPSNRKKIVSSK